MILRKINELMRLSTFEERYEYLRLRGSVGESTFGFDRYVNQRFYRSVEWKRIRDFVIVRDNACDLAFPNNPITDRVVIHHMNPISVDDLERGEEWVMDPMYLITTSMRTHQAIHYGDESILPKPFVERKPGDTNLW